jgi:hypothetical protein
MDPKIKLCICKVMSNAISKTGCMEHTVSGTVPVDDSHMFITTYMLQFHNIPDIIKQTPDQFPPTHIHNQKEKDI